MLAIIAVHLATLAVGLRFFRESGWSIIPLLEAAAFLLAFWALFASAAWFVGSRAVVNHLGLGFVVFWISLLMGGLILLVRWAAGI